MTSGTIPPTWSTDTVLTKGDVGGSYTVDSLIGEGGMALVYKVHHSVLGSAHALKVLSAGGRDVRERLMAEGRVQATMAHENVISVTDFVDVDGTPGLIMEFIDGPSMDDFLKLRRPPLQEALRIFVGILRGVRHAHKRGLVHRDLKPANILLASDEAHEWIPKVADFGLVKALSASNRKGRSTRTGAAMGTPDYMAPEQIRDASDVDRRADLWSLGVILYELVCYERPFQAENMLGLFNAACKAEFIPPRDLVPDLPLGVVRAIEGLLVSDVDKRFGNCDDIIRLFSTDAEVETDAGMSGSGWSHPGASGQWAQLSDAPSKTKPKAKRSAGSLWTSPSLGDAMATTVPLKSVIVAAVSGVMMAGGGLTLFLALNAPDPVVSTTAVPSAPRLVAEVAPSPAAPVVTSTLVSEPPEPVVTAEPTPVAVSVEKRTVKTPPAPVASTPTKPTQPPIKPTPTPTRPTPRPAKPTPVAVLTGTVSWAGDARKVWLTQGGTKFQTTKPVPAGKYTVMAWFNAAAAVEAGTVTVKAGEAVALRCSSFVNQCK